MNILGLSAYSHDSAACLVQDGAIVAAAQEERFTRNKHDSIFPAKAISYCLQQGRITAEDLDYIAFSGKPFIRFERVLKSYLAFAPMGLRPFLKTMPPWIDHKLRIKEHIVKETGFMGKIIFPEHHQSHAASAFFLSPFNDAALLIIDDVGEWATTSYGIGTEDGITILAEMLFPHSLGLLYSAFASYAGFTVKSDRYKLMELAANGVPKYRKLIISELMDLKEDGSFKLNMDYFDCCAGLTMTNPKFDELFGRPPRTPETEPSAMDMDIACSIQAVTETVILKMVEHVFLQTGRKNLCLSGEVALNCVANGRVLRESSFDDIWLQPAASGTGGAVGAALFTWHQYLGNKKLVGAVGDLQVGRYLGPEFTSPYGRESSDREHVTSTQSTEAKLPEKIIDQTNDQQEQMEKMGMAGKDDRNNISQLRKFGILISVVLALLAWDFLWQERSGGFFFSFAAFFLLVLAMFKPLQLKGPYRLWARISEVPARLITKVILTLLFFCVFTPIGMFARLLKIDFLDMKISKNGSSYWDKNPDSYWAPKKKERFGVEHYEKQY